MVSKSRSRISGSRISDSRVSEPQVANRLLATLPAPEYQRLRPALESVSLPTTQIIYEKGQPIEYVYFPCTGVVSLLTTMENGVGVEVATVGNEGMVGVPLFLGFASIPSKATVQVAGEFLRMRAGAFTKEMKRNGTLHRLLHHYTYAMLIQVSQTAACNRLHTLEERLCRWLLMMHDRVATEQFPLTQVFMAQMLGVSRPTVNLAANILQRAGFISYSRGKVTILDRAGLEGSTCECYRVVRAEFDRIGR